jgi:TPP-dependent indolepyruvate ferredoxin oxidoreductase alpha subunit
MVNYKGPSVIISKRTCPLLVEKGKPYEVTDKCNNCGVCHKVLGCPAISVVDKAKSTLHYATAAAYARVYALLTASGGKSR